MQYIENQKFDVAVEFIHVMINMKFLLPIYMVIYEVFIKKGKI